MQLPRQRFLFYRACDTDALCQKLLQNDPGGICRVFTGVGSHMSPEDLETITKKRPDSRESNDLKAVKYTAQRYYIYQSRKSLFPPGSVSQSCLMQPRKSCQHCWQVPRDGKGLPLSAASRPLKANCCVPHVSARGLTGESQAVTSIVDLAIYKASRSMKWRAI